jgi:spoIIIJ-associated protein
MSDMNPSLEVIAPSVDEAVERGADELGVSIDELEVEILDAGSKGLLGVGTRQARIRVTLKADEGRVDSDSVRVASPETTTSPEPEIGVLEEDQDAVRLARETAEDLLERMGVQGTVTADWGEADSPGKMRPLFVDIKGQDLSLLIGRRGETLDALQYILRLILGKELQAPIPVIVDVEGYRARREQTLRRLARRMATQALDRKRILSLEPMPPNERRIIHIELRDHPGVRTESVGEGDRRKVTIIPT